MNEENELPTWMFASGVTHSFEIKEVEPEILLEFNPYDKYGESCINKKLNYRIFGYDYVYTLPDLEPPQIIASVDPIESNPQIQFLKRYS